MPSHEEELVESVAGGDLDGVESVRHIRNGEAADSGHPSLFLVVGSLAIDCGSWYMGSLWPGAV